MAAVATDSHKKYIDRLNDVDAKLDRVRYLVNAHAKTSYPNWGHVGDLGHVCELLDQINDFLGGSVDARRN